MGTLPGSRSVVLVSPGFLLTIDHRADETDLMDRAIRANVTISSLDARGLYTVIPGGNADTPAAVFSPTSANAKMLYAIDSASERSASR